MNFIDIILLVIIGALVVLAVSVQVRNKKRGKGCCNSGCGKCCDCENKS